MSYQGNWRDIFQNWESLCLSYPLFLEHVVTKFLNTSTMDGYNPYRIFDSGFDWEEIDEKILFPALAIGRSSNRILTTLDRSIACP